MTPPPLPPVQRPRPPRAAHLAMAAGLALFVVLLCLVPKPENDLFFELRIGTDILRAHHLPRFDTYSWTNRGTPWVVPEWGAFVLYALAYRIGGFFGTWLLMAGVVLAAAFALWSVLKWALTPVWALGLTALALLASSDFIQERPYVWTYLLLTAGLGMVARSRAEGTGLRGLWPLAALCVVWTNLHQGVVSLVGILAAYAAGDVGAAIWARRQGQLFTEPLRRAGHMAAAAIACTLAACVSPYGWRVYENIFITLHDSQLMANVTEWRPLTAVPLAQLMPILLLLALSAGALITSRRPAQGRIADGAVLLALVAQTLAHARGIPLFAIGAAIVTTPYLAEWAAGLDARRVDTPAHPLRGALLWGFALVYAAVFSLVTVVNLKRNLGPRGWSLEGIGEAAARVPGYPWAACDFMEREQFLLPMRMLNNFEIGGFLMWRLPQQPVFVDGRLDVYAGQTFDNMLILSRDSSAHEWSTLVQKYDLDCVLTTSARQAQAFASSPQWQIVYVQPAHGHRPRCRILLRRRPQYASLIARCLQASTNQQTH